MKSSLARRRVRPRIAHRTRARQHPAQDRWTGRQWAALITVLFGYIIGALNFSGTAIALPAIADELGAGPVAVQWFVVGYGLSATSLVLIAGALGDRYGRRLVLIIAAFAFTAGIGLAAIAPSIEMLIFARVAAGVGSAGLMACGTAVLTSSFIGPSRVKAFAMCGTAGGIGLAVGPTIAGWLVAGAGWRGAFAMLAVASVPMVVSTFFITESRALHPRRFDVIGSIMLIVTLCLFMLGISTLTEGSALAGIVQLAAALLLLTVFVLRSRRVPAPLLEFGLLQDRIVSAWMISGIAAMAGTAGFSVYLPTYLLVVHHLEPGAVGTWMLAYTVPLILTPLIVSRWVTRGGSPTRVTAGALGLAAIAFGAFALLASAANPWVTMAPTALIGIATGAITALSDAHLMGRIDENKIGMAAGLLNTMRHGAVSIVLAVFGSGLVFAIAIQVGHDAAGQLTTGDAIGLASGTAISSFNFGWSMVLAATAVFYALSAAAFVALVISARPAPRRLFPTRPR